MVSLLYTPMLLVLATRAGAVRSAASVQVQAPAVPGLVASQARHVQVKLRA